MAKTEIFAFAVFIGRFQPLHAGHMRTIKAALKLAHQLIIVVGSAHAPRSLRNPWTAPERIHLIEENLTPVERRKVHFLPITDTFYEEDLWTRQVCFGVSEITQGLPTLLVGHNKDETCFYLKNFPQWELKETGNFQGINSTAIRKEYFANKDAGLEGEMWKDPHLISPITHRFLKQFQVLPAYRQLAKDYAEAPEAPPPYTLLVWSAHRDFVLIQKRPRKHGVRLWGLPEFPSLKSQEQTLHEWWDSVPEEARPPFPSKVMTFQANHPHRYPTGQQGASCVSVYSCADDRRVAAVLRGRSSDLAWISTNDIVCKPERCFADHGALVSHLRFLS